MGLFDRAKSLIADGAATSGSTIAAEWPQWTTLAGGNGATQSVVGESHYQPALEAAAKGRGEHGGQRCGVVAQLVREPKNKHDRNAVRVDIAGRTVGYIPAKEAVAYHPVIDSLSREGKPATCCAVLRGGWDRGGSDRGTFGLELDCSPAVRQDGSAFLPMGRQVGITDISDDVDEAALFGDRSEFETVTQLTIHQGRMVAWHGGAVVGFATEKASERYADLFDRVAAAGYPCTATTYFSRPSTTKKRPFDVTVFLPSDVWCSGG